MNTLRDFVGMYRMYRNHHTAAYAARQAWRIVVRGLPF